MKLIRGTKNKEPETMLRELLALRYPQQKQYRWNRQRRSSADLSMMSTISREMIVESLVSGGGANSTGKKR